MLHPSGLAFQRETEKECETKGFWSWGSLSGLTSQRVVDGHHDFGFALVFDHFLLNANGGVCLFNDSLIE